MAFFSFIKHSFSSFHLSKETRLLSSDRRKIFDDLAKKLIGVLPRHRLQGLAWLGISFFAGLTALQITRDNADTQWYLSNRPTELIWKSSFESLGFLESKNAIEAQALSRTLPARSSMDHTVWYRDDGLVFVVIESKEGESSLLPHVFSYDRALKNPVLMKKYKGEIPGWKLVEGSGWKAFTPALEKAEEAAKKWNELIRIHGKAAPKTEARDPRAVMY